MWLLQVPPSDDISENGNLKLVEVFGRHHNLEYAILSHTWSTGEVLFEDVRNGAANQRKGYRKVQAAIKQARVDGFDYIWIDTCCIQKSSSAELQEAINSMYAWYRESGVCYVHLEDIEDPPHVSSIQEYSAKWLERFRQSRWFTRGWTLQELIAPKRKVFFSTNWKALGHIVKPDPYEATDASMPNLTQIVSVATGIEESILQDEKPVQTVSIATRMSWMAGRNCTREEDHAYSLLGIFDVSVPLLYGEADKAFRRLQEEIIRQSDDTSIFRWEHSVYKRRKAMRGLLADAPDCFQKSQHVNSASIEDRLRAMPYTMTNKGLSIHLLMRHIDSNVWLGILDCQSDNESDRDSIYLWRLLEDANHFVRIFPHRLSSISQENSAVVMTILVRQGIEHSGLWGNNDSSTETLHEDWLQYSDPITHIVFDPADDITRCFSIEFGRRKWNAGYEVQETEIHSQVTSDWDALAHLNPIPFKFGGEEAHTLEDAILLSETIQNSLESAHSNEECATLQREKQAVWRGRSVPTLSRRSDLCCILRHNTTGERIAIILSHERESISVRAVPIGMISHAYHVHIEGTQVRFEDSPTASWWMKALTAHITLHLQVTLVEDLKVEKNVKAIRHYNELIEHGCTACADLDTLESQLTHPLGKRGRIYLLGDCHQSEREVELTISPVAEKKSVRFKEEVIER